MSTLFDDLVAAHVSPYAPRGQDNKRRYLHHFAIWCQSEGIDPTMVSRQNLDMWRGHLLAKGQMPRSINTEMGVIRSFCRWMVEEGYWGLDPSRYLRNLPAPAQVTLAWLNDEQTACLLDHVDQEADPVMRGLIYVLTYLGVRPQEARALDSQDVDLEGETIVFRGRKDGRLNRFQLSLPVAQALTPLVGPQDTPLFLNCHTGRRVSKEVAQKRFNRLVRGAGVPRITMYGLRAGFATNALEAGVSIRDLQAAMGHASSHMTSLYDQARESRASVAQMAAAERISELRAA